MRSLAHWFLQCRRCPVGGRRRPLFNLFSGGALAHCAIFSLGIMPYISASIMLQLLTAVVPQLGKLAREDGGRQKIMQYTRYATIALCFFQGYPARQIFRKPSGESILAWHHGNHQAIGMHLVSKPGIGFPAHDDHHHDRRHDVSHVAR